MRLRASKITLAVIAEGLLGCRGADQDFVTEGTLSGPLDLVDPSQLLYESHWPFTPTPIIAGLAERLETLPHLDAEALESMTPGNALRLFPRLAAPF